jgi:hypothetical protein
MAVDGWPSDETTPPPVLVNAGMTEDEANRVLLENEVQRLRLQVATLTAENDELKSQNRKLLLDVLAHRKGKPK